MSETGAPTGASPSLVAFDALPAHEARTLLESACGSSAWVSGMVERRPFGTVRRLLDMADELWWSLTPDDWREAFGHHPRIGERDAASGQGARARAWSESEQRGASSAAEAVRRALARANGGYEQRFGHIFIVCAAGKSADEMLAILRERLANDPATELRIAAGEQAKITRLRLVKMFDDEPSAGESSAGEPSAPSAA